MIRITVNGTLVELEAPTPLATFLSERQIQRALIAVDHNGIVLHRHEYDGVTLDDGDTLEIVRMVGGG